MASQEKKIKNFAKEVAKTVKKPTSTIKIPFEKEIQYEVEKEIEVEEGWFIFKSTRIEKVMERRTGRKVDYKDVPIDGWIFKTYYENVDTVVKSGRIQRSVMKWFYVLKKDGNLSVFTIGYDILQPNTNWEELVFSHELSEHVMHLDFSKADLFSKAALHGKFRPTDLVSHACILLDFKPVKWELTSKRSYETLYFKRNYPLGTEEGLLESEGGSYIIQKPGTGLMRALKNLNREYVHK